MNRAAGLSSDENVRAAVHHSAGAATVLVEVVQAVRLSVIDEHRLAAVVRHPGIWAATQGVDARIVDPEGGTVVNHDIGRASNCRTDALVGATIAAMSIHGRQRAITKAGKRFQRPLVYTENAPKERESRRR